MGLNTKREKQLPAKPRHRSAAALKAKNATLGLIVDLLGPGQVERAVFLQDKARSAQGLTPAEQQELATLITAAREALIKKGHVTQSSAEASVLRPRPIEEAGRGEPRAKAEKLPKMDLLTEKSYADALREVAKWKTPLFDIGQIKETLKRYDKGELVDWWRLEASIIKLSAQEKQEVLDWMKARGFMEKYNIDGLAFANTFFMHRIVAILDFRRMRSSARVDGFYRYFPVFELWQPLYEKAAKPRGSLHPDYFKLPHGVRYSEEPFGEKFIEMTYRKRLIGHGFGNNTVSTANFCNTPWVLCNYWAMLSTMTEGLKEDGETGYFNNEHEWQNVALYGPCYMLCNKSLAFGEKYDEQRVLYIVPSDEDAAFLVEAMGLAMTRKIITITAEEANRKLARVMTYKQAVERQGDLKAILNRQMQYDSGLRVTIRDGSQAEPEIITEHFRAIEAQI